MHDTYSLAKSGMAGSDHMPEKKIKHIVTRKSANGGHVHEHHHTHPDVHPMEEHTTQGDDGMVGHMMDNMGTPNPGEAQADAGQSGIPPAAPTGAPAAPSMPMGA